MLRRFFFTSDGNGGVCGMVRQKHREENVMNMRTLHCELGGHDWERESRRGRLPRNCPAHQPDTAPSLPRFVATFSGDPELATRAKDIVRTAIAEEALVVTVPETTVPTTEEMVEATCGCTGRLLGRHGGRYAFTTVQIVTACVAGHPAHVSAGVIERFLPDQMRVTS